MSKPGPIHLTREAFEALESMRGTGTPHHNDLSDEQKEALYLARNNQSPISWAKLAKWWALQGWPGKRGWLEKQYERIMRDGWRPNVSSRVQK